MGVAIPSQQGRESGIDLVRRLNTGGQGDRDDVPLFLRRQEPQAPRSEQPPRVESSAPAPEPEPQHGAGTSDESVPLVEAEVVDEPPRGGAGGSSASPRPPRFDESRKKLGEFLQQCKDWMQQARRRPFWKEWYVSALGALVAVMAVVLMYETISHNSQTSKPAMLSSDEGLVTAITKRFTHLEEQVGVVSGKQVEQQKSIDTLTGGQAALTAEVRKDKADLDARVNSTAAAIPRPVGSDRLEALFKDFDEMSAKTDAIQSKLH